MIIKRKLYKKILTYMLGCDSCRKPIRGEMVMIAYRRQEKGIHGRRQWITTKKYNFHVGCAIDNLMWIYKDL